MTDEFHGLGALRTPPELLAKGWPIALALAAPPTAVPVGRFHSAQCDLHTTINQSPFGACVMFSGAYVQADQELADEGKQLNPGVLDPLRTYAEVKGLPWPLTDPSQDPNPGLNPPQLWDYTKRVGWATKDGSPRRKDGPYYSLGRPSSSLTWFALYKATIDALGPVQVTTAWAHNWYATDTTGHLAPASSVIDGGHAWEGCGGELFVDGRIDLIGHQTWGAFGHDPNYPNHFRMRGVDVDAHGWEAWKVTDIKGDAPSPPPPPPLQGDVMRAYDRQPRLVDIAGGVQLYRTDGVTPLVKMSTLAGGVYSGHAVDSASLEIVITTGGVMQAAIVRRAACRNVRNFVCV